MKPKYMCLDSALDLWPPGHFALEFFASRIGRSEMECSDVGFSYNSAMTVIAQDDHLKAGAWAACDSSCDVMLILDKVNLLVCRLNDNGF